MCNLEYVFEAHLKFGQHFFRNVLNRDLAEGLWGLAKLSILDVAKI